MHDTYVKNGRKCLIDYCSNMHYWKITFPFRFWLSETNFYTIIIHFSAFLPVPQKPKGILFDANLGLFKIQVPLRTGNPSYWQ